MINRPLGNTGIFVSEIAFGGVEIGIPYGIGVKSQEDMLSESEAVYLLHSAIDSGINFFDTARLYGNSEHIMGMAFKDRRDQVVLSTKCIHLRNPDGKLPDSKKLTTIIKDSLIESLNALQTDYVDVFMLHTADEEILNIPEISHTFSELKESGVVRAIGASTYLPEETQRVIETGIWDVIQMPFNLMDQRQQAFFSLASEKGIGIVIRSVLLKGLLSERGKNLHPALKEVEVHIESYKALLNNISPDLPTLAARFALSFKEISAVLVGIDKMEYLYKSLEAADGIYMDKIQQAQAKALRFPDPEFLNLHTWNQKGWFK
jgi:aryl-alcohol dehydrogenase-like predicted oxidoreductase